MAESEGMARDRHAPTRYIVWDVRPDGVAEISAEGADYVEEVTSGHLNALVGGGRFRPAAVQFALPGLRACLGRAGEEVAR